jgi:dihydrofolate synthase/folylpolyglutamate synthase
VLLDGAHNPHASRVLRAALQSGFPRRGLFLVLGILGDKDARSILGDLSARALPPRELESLVGDASQAPVEVVPEVGAALEAALSSAGAEDLVCVTGSLTTVGEARGWLRSKGWVR